MVTGPAAFGSGAPASVGRVRATSVWGEMLSLPGAFSRAVRLRRYRVPAAFLGTPLTPAGSLWAYKRTGQPCSRHAAKKLATGCGCLVRLFVVTLPPGLDARSRPFLLGGVLPAVSAPPGGGGTL